MAERSLEQSTQFSWVLFLVGVAALPISPLVLLVSWLICLILAWRSGPSVLSTPPMRWLGVTALALTVTTFFSYRLTDSLLGLFNYLPFFLFFGLALCLVRSEERLVQVLRVALASGLITGVAGVVEWVSGQNWRWAPLPGVFEVLVGSKQETGILERVTSFFGWPTSAAAYFLLILPLSVAMVLGTARPTFRDWVTLGTMATALVGTASRNAWGVLLLVVCALMLMAKRIWPVAVLVLAAILVLLAGAGPDDWAVVAFSRQIVPAVLWQKVAASLESGTSSYESLTNRWDAWHTAWDMLWQRPLTGWGLQTFPFVEAEVYHRDAEMTLHPHNIYLTYFAEAGLPTGLLLTGFYAWSVAAGTRRALQLHAARTDDPQTVHRFWRLVGLVAGVVAYLAFGLFDVPFYDSRINAMFWLWLGLVWHHTLELDDT